jgi:hypothetical protein
MAVVRWVDDYDVGGEREEGKLYGGIIGSASGMVKNKGARV